MRDSYTVGPDWCDLTGADVFDPGGEPSTTRYFLAPSPYESKPIARNGASGIVYLTTPRQGRRICARNGADIKRALIRWRAMERRGEAY